jgi:hypothetical protein
MLIRVEQGEGRKNHHVMLAPDLFDLWRQWWRVKRARGRLFPSQQPGQPITTHQLDWACHAAAKSAKLDKRGLLPVSCIEKRSRLPGGIQIRTM